MTKPRHVVPAQQLDFFMPPTTAILAKTALITPLPEQDGSYLAKLLLEKSYLVWDSDMTMTVTMRAVSSIINN